VVANLYPGFERGGKNRVEEKNKFGNAFGHPGKKNISCNPGGIPGRESGAGKGTFVLKKS